MPLLEQLLNAIGGGSTSGGDIQIDPITGQTIYNPQKANHPWLAALSGKDDEITKMNQIAKMFAAQQNAHLGEMREQSRLGNESYRQKLVADFAAKYGRAPTIKEIAMMEQQEPSSALYSKVGQELSSARDASIAKSEADIQAENLKTKQGRALNDTFDSRKYKQQQDMLESLKTLITLPKETTLGLPQTNERGDIFMRMLGQGALHNEIPETMKIPGPNGTMMEYPTGKSHMQTIPGQFTIPNIKADVDRIKMRDGGGINFSGYNPSMLTNANTQSLPIAPSPIITPSSPNEPRGFDEANRHLGIAMRDIRNDIWRALKSIGITPGIGHGPDY